MIPSPPALDTALASFGVPTHYESQTFYQFQAQSSLGDTYLHPALYDRNAESQISSESCIESHDEVV